MGAVVAIAAAQRVRREREMIKHLREENALSAASATELRPQRRIGKAVLRKLVSERAVLQTGDDLYWLDEPAYAAMRSRRQRFALVTAVIVLVVSLAVVGIALALTPH